jgi:hypothetical protein
MIHIEHDPVKALTRISVELTNEELMRMDRDTFRRHTGEAFRGLHEACLRYWDQWHEEHKA